MSLGFAHLSWRRAALGGVIALVSLLLIACDSDDSSDETSPTAEPPSEPTATATAAAQSPTPDGAGQAAPPPTANLREECVEDYREGVNYFPEQVTVEHAVLFDVEYHDHYKVVRTSARGDYFTRISASDVYVLVQCGTPVPELTGSLNGAVVIEVPTMRIAVGNNEDFAAFHELGVADRLVAVGTPPESDNAWHPDLKALIDSGVPVVGTSFNMNLESVVAADPDLLVLLTWIGNQHDTLLRAREFGIPAVGQHLWLEPTPLARAEWLEFFSLFVNGESTANEIVSEIESNYEELATLVAGAERPTVFAASIGSSVNINSNDFVARYIEDAGGTNVLADPEGPLHPQPFTLEGVVEQAADADVWFSEFNDQLERDGAPIDAFSATSEGSVISPAPAVPLSGTSWFGDAIFNVDGVLADFIAVLHPDALPDHELVYLDQLGPAADE